PERRQYEKVAFAPGKDIPEASNLWRGFAVKAGFDDSATKCSLYLSHIREIIFQRDSYLYDYVIKWMAAAVQRPDQPGGVALVLRSGQGSGKGEFVRHYSRLFGLNYAHVSKSEQVTGRFNGHLEGAILLFADESFFAGDPRHEPILKAMVTERTQVIERKGIDAITYPSCLHIIMATNDDWAVRVSADDRRFCCMAVSDARRSDSAYFAAIEAQMKAGGYEA